MTKRDKKECSALGCHLPMSVDIQTFSLLLDDVIKQYFCSVHWVQYIGYMATFFVKNEDYKEIVFDGIDLYRESENEGAKIHVV